jgi:hypothetical protein
MKIFAFVLCFIFASTAFGQKTFELKDASKYFDIKVEVAECEDGYCEGAAKFSFFKKGGKAPYQVIELPNTQIQLDDDGTPLANVALLYDKQSVVNIGDFNFDGMEDVALCDGPNGSYGGPSYQVYLSSRAAGKFVHSAAFSELGQKLGMFVVDTKSKRLRTFDKSGCCWHITEEFSVVGNKPLKVYSQEEDAMNGERMKITTKTRVNGKWKTVVTYRKIA